MRTNGCFSKLHVLGFGLAFGIVGALGMFLMGLFAMGGWGTDFVNTLGSFYVGFKPTFLGSIVGAIWGFVNSFINGIIIAALYNLFLRCCCKEGKVCKPGSEEIKS